ncbi:MAG: hypothetical protein K0S47_43 [Herbinix sp.]|jgi:glycosyltransferase involved in cell wall biosynthesis|nr:hypothetical protein [Herbinix sp.]
MVDSLLSVVLIAKKNTSLSFLRALESIINQVYTSIQILVVDANEPNSMYSLGLQEDLEAYPKVEYLQMDQSLSMAKIKNYVLHYVKGYYIAFLTSNDVWDSTKALLQVKQMEENPGAVASCSNGVLIDERKVNVAVDPLIEHLTYETSKWILDNPAKMSAQVIYKSEVVKAIGGFDELFVNFCDGDMLLRLSERSKVLLLPVSLCECYITPDNENYDWNNLKDNQKILYKYMNLFLVNKPLSQMFYARMILLAKSNYLWLNYYIYMFMYFLKAPGRTVLLLFTKIRQIFKYLFKWTFMELSLWKDGMRVNKDMRIIQKGKLENIKALRPITEVEEMEGKPVVFSSARQYSEQKTLDFAFDHKLKSIVIPEYVTIIKRGMFYGCDHLISVEIPSTVLEIQAHAFRKCKKLRNVIIHEGSRLGKIGAYAFANCSSLETISLPSSVVEIGAGAFVECSSLKQLLFTNMFRGEEKTSSDFPSAIAKIPRYTFAGCLSLLSVEFSVNSILEKIETGAFMGCGKLRKIVMTGKVKSLASYTFAYCKKLEIAAFPQIDALTTIGKCAFMNCESLAYFQLPNQIDRINLRTFYGCSSLKLVKIPKKVLSISHQAFAKCSNLTKAMILTGDIAISPTAFEKHTEVQILENVNKDTSSEK